MTRTSSISGTLVKRQRSPVSVAAASSLSAAFLLPLIGTRTAQRSAAVDPEGLALDRRFLVFPVERARVSHRCSRACADLPSRCDARRPGCAAVHAAERPGREPGQPTPRSLLPAPLGLRRACLAVSRSISEAMSAVSAMTTTFPAGPGGSRRRWRSTPPRHPRRMRSSPTPSVVSSGAWCGRTPSSPSIPGQTTESTSLGKRPRSGVTISRWSGIVTLVELRWRSRGRHRGCRPGRRPAPAGRRPCPRGSP